MKKVLILPAWAFAFLLFAVPARAGDEFRPGEVGQVATVGTIDSTGTVETVGIVDDDYGDCEDDDDCLLWDLLLEDLFSSLFSRLFEESAFRIGLIAPGLVVYEAGTNPGTAMNAGFVIEGGIPLPLGSRWDMEPGFRVGWLVAPVESYGGVHITLRHYAEREGRFYLFWRWGEGSFSSAQDTYHLSEPGLGYRCHDWLRLELSYAGYSRRIHDGLGPPLAGVIGFSFWFGFA